MKMSIHNRLKHFNLILLIFGLVIVAFVLIFSLVLNNKKPSSVSSIWPIVNNSSPAIRGVNVSPNVSKGFTVTSSLPKNLQKGLSIQGGFYYSKMANANTSIVEYSWGKYNMNTSKKVQKSIEHELQNVMRQNGVSINYNNKPDITINGSGYKLYKLSCKGVVINLPTNKVRPSVDINYEFCIGRFNRGRQYLSIDVADTSGQNPQSLELHFASGTTIEF